MYYVVWLSIVWETNRATLRVRRKHETYRPSVGSMVYSLVSTSLPTDDGMCSISRHCHRFGECPRRQQNHDHRLLVPSARKFNTVLVYCWATVYYAGLTFNQY